VLFKLPASTKLYFQIMHANINHKNQTSTAIISTQYFSQL